MTDPFTQLSAATQSQAPRPQFVDDLRAQIKTIELAVDAATGWHLAQLNMGLFKMSLDAPEMAPFVESLDRINALADASPGFIWRLQGDNGEPSSFVDVPGATDPMVASNLSVWTDLESLHEFMYRTDHAAYMRRRAEWFEREREVTVVAWWIPAGTLPDLPDALRRLDHLRAHGPSDEGFPLGKSIPPPPAHHEV